jgi:DNA-binding response OmpR family regulator
VEVPGHILIVEDDAAARRVMEVALRSAGYSVSSTGTATDALLLLEARQPDLMVLDLVMPGMDGESFCQDARAKGYDGRVLLASGSESVRESASRLGAEFIRKPFDPENRAQL